MVRTRYKAALKEADNRAGIVFGEDVVDVRVPCLQLGMGQGLSVVIWPLDSCVKCLPSPQLGFGFL